MSGFQTTTMSALSPLPLSMHHSLTHSLTSPLRSCIQQDLLKLAEDLARRLLPAFETQTGMPYGTVNLKHGVPQNETPVTCTACTSTFSLEFGYLTLLTGDDVFRKTAKAAVRAVWRRRSQRGLVGGHINVETGAWTQMVLLPPAPLLSSPTTPNCFFCLFVCLFVCVGERDWRWSGQPL